MDEHAIWSSVDKLVDRASSTADLLLHRLATFAARRLRAQGHPVPAQLEEEERLAAITAMTAPEVLARARDAYDGPMMLLKGPEVAARYPDPLLRPFHDLDLLVHDAGEAHRALLAAGFQVADEKWDKPGIQHRTPLLWPGLPLLVEIHDRPKWVQEISAPPTEELFTLAGPSAANRNVLALSSGPHALLLAVHSWAHQPLRRVLDLVDVLLVSREADPHELSALAEHWHVARLWHTVQATALALLAEGPTPLLCRIWARNLSEVRERTVLETHLERWLSPLGAWPARQALAAAGAALRDDLQPAPGESWAAKLGSVSVAIRHSFMPESDHERH
jgi:hypothetical protein